MVPNISTRVTYRGDFVGASGRQGYYAHANYWKVSLAEQIILDNWEEGWIPSSNSQADFGAPSKGLLRMDNLTLDEKGSLRLANGPSVEGNITEQINSIYAAFVGNRKLRYLYTTSGKCWRNYGTAVSQTVYDLAIFTSGGLPLKAAFGNFSGHVVVCAGIAQFKDRGDIQWTLTIPQPAPPVLTNLANTTVSLENLDGGGNYTNWTAPSSSAFNNAGAAITITPNVTTNVASWQTIFAAVVDTTNFGVTGENNDNDPFTFNLQIADPTQLNYIRVDLFCTDPTAGPTSDSFYAEYDYLSAPGSLYFAVNNFAVGVTNTVTFLRSQFFRQGSDPALGFATVKAIRLTVGVIATTALSAFNKAMFSTGVVTGSQTYLCVELNDTGQFVQWSIASTQVTVQAGTAYVRVNRSGTACNLQVNQIRFFRNNAVLGQFIQVNAQSGAYGFTPASFDDKLSDNDALAAAAVDATRVLQYFRTQLPTTIRGMIWFASRAIYLTSTSFFPSYQLDFGSYDSRFTYELNSTNSEICLFIAKINVGTFIVATTVDFYQVTGDFSLVSATLPDGTTLTTQNINILPLGISDPAINSSFIELEGSILYMSARGLRSMANGSSALLNTTTDLLFRGEDRYSFPHVALQPNDLSLIGMVSSGTRIYLGLPFSNGANAVLVSTFNPPAPSELRGGSYWRPITYATALCMCRELDGTVLYGTPSGSVIGLENSLVSNVVPVDFLTQFNYGQSPASPKKLGGFKILVDTGANTLTLNVMGLREDATVASFAQNINTNGSTLVEVDVGNTLDLCVAFAANITGNTNVFDMGYIIYIIVQDYPPLTFYAVQLASNFDLNKQLQLSKWPFLADPLGGTITATVTADGVALPLPQTLSGAGPQTGYWYSKNHIKAVDWQIELHTPTGMRLYKINNPDILQEYPTITYYAIVPFTNFGKDTVKKISKWGFVVDTLGFALTALVTAGSTQIANELAVPSGGGISTKYWYNFEDIAAVDWQLEIFAPQGMRFYKFMQPDILQVFPPGRLFDQFGPLDLDREGIVFMMRLRLYSEGASLHYDVYDADVLSYSNNITLTMGKDTTYEETFPKGINTSVFRILLSSTAVYYRFSLELKVRTTGKETEQHWIKL